MPRTKKDTTKEETMGKSERAWVSAYDANNNLKYTVTSNKDRSVYYIYDKDFKRLGRGKSPLELERKFFGKE